MTTTDRMPAPATKGLVMHSEARYYDLLAWVLTLGRERAFRERLVELARLEPGEMVLDVGCGTGTLAIAAKRRVGTSGAVHGIDASPEMIERAKRKAGKAGVDVVFQTGVVEALPFPDASFDAVLSTLMLHHLPRPARELCAREMRRVLKPGGRVLAVDFMKPAGARSGLLARAHRHGHVALRDITDLLGAVELSVVESGSVGVSDLQFALAKSPRADDDDQHERQTHTSRTLAPLPTPRWIWPALALALVAGHGIVLSAVSSRIAIAGVAVVGAGALLVLAHSPLVGALHALLRRRGSVTRKRPSQP